MSTLKEKFAQIKTAIAHAINFADPEKVLQNAEHEFLEATANAYHALEDRVVELEQKLQSLIDPTASAGEPVGDSAGGTVDGAQAESATGEQSAGLSTSAAGTSGDAGNAGAATSGDTGATTSAVATGAAGGAAGAATTTGDAASSTTA